MKNIKEVIKKAEEMDWIVTEEGDNQYLFSKFSPAGQDFNISAGGEDAKEIINNMYEWYKDFDISYETYIWLDDTGHGTNGAPYDMKDLYNDMEACQEMVLELYEELKGLDLDIYNSK